MRSPLHSEIDARRGRGRPSRCDKLEEESGRTSTSS